MINKIENRFERVDNEGSGFGYDFFFYYLFCNLCSAAIMKRLEIKTTQSNTFFDSRLTPHRADDDRISQTSVDCVCASTVCLGLRWAKCGTEFDSQLTVERRRDFNEFVRFSDRFFAAKIFKS